MKDHYIYDTGESYQMKDIETDEILEEWFYKDDFRPNGLGNKSKQTTHV